MDRVNILIIGGGVVGCAIAAELAARWDNVFLVEQLPRLGMATSTRNSGVLHSGIYYPPGSLKARLCVSGNVMTKEFCAAHGVPHDNCGKLVVATQESEIAALEKLAANGRANGVEGLRIVDRARIRQREPHVSAVAALEVPSTGIVEAEALVKAYARIAVERGANILNHARVVELKPCADSIAVVIELDDDSLFAVRQNGAQAEFQMLDLGALGIRVGSHRFPKVYSSDGLRGVSADGRWWLE